MKVIKDFPNYGITEDGRVISKRLNGGEKAQQTDQHGYKVVTLSHDGERKIFKIHRLVAEHYIHKNLNPLADYVNHKDGNKLNNSADNLEWCTASENVRHAYRTGLRSYTRGESSPNSKLTEWDVHFIRLWHSQKYKLQEIAETFSVTKSLVEKVVYRKSWAHLEDISTDVA